MTPEEQARYDRWAKASVELVHGSDGPDWEHLIDEEQAAWDDMADHDDPEYNRILDVTKP